jgi:hypothetical protein
MDIQSLEFVSHEHGNGYVVLVPNLISKSSTIILFS